MNYEAREYESVEWLLRWGKRGFYLFLAVIIVGVGLWGYTQVQIERQIRTNMQGVVTILNYNIQAGTIKVPAAEMPPAVAQHPPQPPRPEPPK